MSTMFVVLLLAGLFLIGAEIFVPGGVIGSIGALCLLASIALGFAVFPPNMAFLVAVAIVALLGVCLYLWIKFFPKTPVGKSMTLSRDIREYKAHADVGDLMGKEGTAQSALRPAGIARIEGRRIDVVAESDWVQVGAPIRVIQVDGGRVVVRAVHAADRQAPGQDAGGKA